MFETTQLLTLLLAPVVAYMAGALLFFAYELLHKDNAQPVFKGDSHKGGMSQSNTYALSCQSQHSLPSNYSY